MKGLAKEHVCIPQGQGQGQWFAEGQGRGDGVGGSGQRGEKGEYLQSCPH